MWIKRLSHVLNQRFGRIILVNRKHIFLCLVGLSVIAIGAAAIFLRQTDQPTTAENYAPVWNWNFVNKTVVIDAGHGGIDPGTIGYSGVHEKDVNLAVSLKLKDYLTQSGVRVVMIREDDRDFGTTLTRPSQNKAEDLAHRIQIVAEAKADVILSIHGNSYPDRKQQGSQVFYYKGSEKGPQLAKTIQDRLNAVTGHPRTTRTDNFYMLRNTQGIALTVEIGFLSSPEEEKRLVDPDYQSKIALAIALGVADYLEK